MMHESEKSDSVVVAGKPTNKAARAVAEPVEPRTGTQGNVGQQSTRRAQDRESVSQALERVRQAARQRKKERFTALLHHVDLAMLRTAFYAIKRDAAPGVDGMKWETYEQGLDRRRDFLWRETRPGEFLILAARPPTDPRKLFSLEYKSFAPIGRLVRDLTQPPPPGPALVKRRSLG